MHAASSVSRSASQRPAVILTVGHSTRPIEKFIELLHAHGVERLVDVRTAPGSRRYPQFNQEALEQSLHDAGMDYKHIKALGGFRRSRPDSPNTGWKNASFRGFADYMLTKPFRDGLRELLRLASDKRTAIMCSEAVPWRCHRSLISDMLLVRGMNVEHIISVHKRNPHQLTKFGRVEGDHVVYPPAEESPCGTLYDDDVK